MNVVVLRVKERSVTKGFVVHPHEDFLVNARTNTGSDRIANLKVDSSELNSRARILWRFSVTICILSGADVLQPVRLRR